MAGVDVLEAAISKAQAEARRDGRESDFVHYMTNTGRRFGGGKTISTPWKVGDTWMCLAPNGFEYIELPHYGEPGRI